MNKGDAFYDYSDVQRYFPKPDLMGSVNYSVNLTEKTENPQNNFTHMKRHVFVRVETSLWRKLQMFTFKHLFAGRIENFSTQQLP